MNEAHAGAGPDFSIAVPQDGYAWWYVDAFSDCGAYGLTAIAFIGSVFSPYYAAARRRGEGDPVHHSALNVALYGRGGKRWALTERGRGDVRRDRHVFQVGPSGIAWDGTALTITVDEISVPLPRRLRGSIKIIPQAVTRGSFVLSESGRHVWCPIAPIARAEVIMKNPDRSWSGHAYFDHNRGDRPLEADFKGWTWSRANRPEGATIFYDCERRDGSPFGLALNVNRDGAIETITPPPKAPLPPTPVWRFPRETRSEDVRSARILKTFEDTPFYARSMCETIIGGVPAVAMHESLSLDRFSSRWVQTLLPFRMPRIAKG